MLWKSPPKHPSGEPNSIEWITKVEAGDLSSILRVFTPAKNS
jgi:hypothetical protein